MAWKWAAVLYDRDDNAVLLEERLQLVWEAGLGSSRHSNDLR